MRSSPQTFSFSPLPLTTLPSCSFFSSWTTLKTTSLGGLCMTQSTPAPTPASSCQSKIGRAIFFWALRKLLALCEKEKSLGNVQDFSSIQKALLLRARRCACVNDSSAIFCNKQRSIVCFKTSRSSRCSLISTMNASRRALRSVRRSAELEGCSKV
jgi:hypothetical protein